MIVICNLFIFCYCPAKKHPLVNLDFFNNQAIHLTSAVIRLLIAVRVVVKSNSKQQRLTMEIPVISMFISRGCKSFLFPAFFVPVKPLKQKLSMMKQLVNMAYQVHPEEKIFLCFLTFFSGINLHTITWPLPEDFHANRNPNFPEIPFRGFGCNEEDENNQLHKQILIHLHLESNQY